MIRQFTANFGLDLAAHHSSKVAKLLMEFGANSTLRNNFGSSSSEHAISNKLKDSINTNNDWEAALSEEAQKQKKHYFLNPDGRGVQEQGSDDNIPQQLGNTPGC